MTGRAARFLAAAPDGSLAGDPGVLDTLEGMLDSLLQRLPYLAFAVVVYALFHFTGVAVRRIVRRVASRRRNRNLGLVFGRLAQGLIWLVGLFVAAVIAIPRFTPGQLVQLLGLSGVAVGFAFRDILQNFLAGILILLTEPFRIDDQIVFGEYEGTVEDIQTRATYLRTYDGRRIVIPNAELYTRPVTVNTAFPVRRLEYDIGLAESAVNLRVLWWVTPPGGWRHSPPGTRCSTRSRRRCCRPASTCLSLPARCSCRTRGNPPTRPDEAARAALLRNRKMGPVSLPDGRGIGEA